VAYLVDIKNQTHCYLHAHHSFGRFAYSVDTLLSNPCISKIHAIIEWHNNQWCIRDLSSNGTWINNKKLVKEQIKPLKIGDIIHFMNDGQASYQVNDLSAPCDLLIPYSINGSTANAEKITANSSFSLNAITLLPYHLLPNEESPEVALIFNQKSEQWHIEYIAEPELKPRLLQDNDLIEINQQQWQLNLSHLVETTQKQQNQQISIEDLNCIFELSANEEITKLKVISPEDTIDLHTRSHHYLTLNLARYRVEDANNGISSAEQGWVNTDRLIKDLGVDMAHLNIQIHRSRKQFSDMLSNVYDAENVIERQLRQVRFACPAFEIHKGHQLESSLNQVQPMNTGKVDLSYYSAAS
jgi:pSer/pThr/pTyr-binding forkhead associated (FHA) protein